jgi:tRNA pseudouridine55 synthase
MNLAQSPAALPRLPRRAVHGVLLLDKPLGLSSQQALQRAKRLFRAEKAGHTGTLDPLASGLLPLCFGAATKFAGVSLDADKRYRATVALGRVTSTGDAEGEVLQERPVELQPGALQAALEALTGCIEQVPPMHSALKRNGRPLYAYARAGLEVEREARRVTIHNLLLLSFEPGSATLVLDVHCSKGTYVRTLAEAIGRALGCGAHLAALRRTGSGAFRIEQAITLATIESMPEPQRDALLLPADSMLSAWPQVRLPDDEAGRFLAGLRRRVTLDDVPAVRVYGPQAGAFLGSAHISAGELIADRLLSPLEVRALLAAQTASPGANLQP